MLLPRGFAYVVDTLIMYALFKIYPESLIIGTPTYTYLALMMIYLSVMEIYAGATVGKKLVGLCVSDEYGYEASAIRILLRNFIKIAGLNFFFLTYITVPFTGKAVHDMLARTDVEEDFDDEDDDDYDEGDEYEE